MEVPSIRQVSRTYWWLLLIRGIFAVLFGILAIIAPAVAALFFIFLFGAYVLLDGILSIVVSLQERNTNSRWNCLLFSSRWQHFGHCLVDRRICTRAWCHFIDPCNPV